MPSITILIIISSSIFLSSIIISLYILKRIKQKSENKIKELEEEMNQKIYEVLILKEINERIGYSLSIQKIAEIISSSLGQLIPYSTVSYLLLSKPQVIFRCHLQETVSYEFIETVKKRMLDGLSALINQDLSQEFIDQGLSGAIVNNEEKRVVASFFNIPLVIGDKAVGMLNVASDKSNVYQEQETTILYKITSAASNAVTKLQEVIDIEQGKFKRMVQTMQDGVILLDKDSQVSLINASAKQYLGLSSNDSPSLFDIATQLVNKFDFSKQIKKSKEEKITNLVKEVLFQDKFLDFIISPVLDKTDDFLGTLILVHDKTAEKTLERIREDYVAMMVHELRAPLSVVRGSADILIHHLEKMERERQEKLLQMIKKSSTSMLDLVNQLLDAAKIEAGKFTVSKMKSDLTTLLQEKAEAFKILADQKGIKLEKQINKLPEFEFDKERIGQVLTNLLSNAVKYTEQGKITLSAEQKGDKIAVAVADTGRGMNKEGTDNLFSKFKRLKSATETEGTGLGLVIVKGIVEAHDGKIEVESEVDKGSVFRFELPMK